MSLKLPDTQKRQPITLTLDPDIIAYLDQNKDGDRGRSEQVNRMLRVAISHEATERITNAKESP
jgi:hypothetical protein